MSVLPDAGCVEVLVLMHPPICRKMKTLEAKYWGKGWLMVELQMINTKYLLKSIIVKITYMVN